MYTCLSPLHSSVTANGYYFFVFSSENEVERNYVRTSFNIKKAIYDVSHPVAKCNATLGKCTLPLDFLSNEQVGLTTFIQLLDKS